MEDLSLSRLKTVYWQTADTCIHQQQNISVLLVDKKTAVFIVYDSVSFLKQSVKVDSSASHTWINELLNRGFGAEVSGSHLQNFN